MAMAGRGRELSGNSQDSSEGYESPYFEEYNLEGDSYSLAWRYLGVYIDDSDGSYSRKVLWAAYYDPNYEGNQIGEYQYYDMDSESWDSSTCVSGNSTRCAKMDCHDASSSDTWEIVGVYKDSLDFDNDAFFEQLFKHQGVCLWGGTSSSSYQFMQNMRKNWQGTCQKLAYGIYVGTKPLEDGDITYALYYDSKCKREATRHSLSDYLSNSYDWDEVFEKWNNYMGVYKICQPCRAYSRTENYQDTWSDSPSDDSNDRRHRDRRYLIEYNDGEGEEEINGFNCYDDAGYRNCNQCFKFDTHTDMEEASASDLKRASSQGTILEVTYNGVTYGGGSTGSNSQYYEVSSVGIVSMVMLFSTLVGKMLLRPSRAKVNLNGGDQPLAR